MSEQAEPRVFAEQLTGLFAPDVYRSALPLLLVSGFAYGVGWVVAAAVLGALGLFCVLFFRNPARELPPGDSIVVAPADGRVLCVDEVEREDGGKALRIGIFLSVFDVHVNRAPIAGRVTEVSRSGSRFLAAFNRDAETQNVQLRMVLDTAIGRVDVVQITGLIARRIVFQPDVGEFLEPGVRYGLIRFGSRTDVVLPAGAIARVAPGDTVRGGKTIVAEWPDAAQVASAARAAG